MKYRVGVIIAAIAAFLAWLWSLLAKNKELTREVEKNKDAAQVKEWSDQIASLESRIKEEEKDYEEAKKKLNDPK